MSSAPRTGRVGRRAFGALVERQTYRNLLYLFLAIPLGFLYYGLFGFGLLFGLVLTLFLVGVAILFGVLLGARLVAEFERRLANALLDLDLRSYDDVRDAEGSGVGFRVRPYVDAPSTWRAVGFLSLKTLVSVLAVIGLILVATVGSMLAAPLRYPTAVEFGELNGEPLAWSIDTAPEAVLAGVLGAILLLFLLHLANGVAYVCGRMAAALLGESASDARNEPSSSG